MKSHEAGAAFLTHCERERHLSANTVAAYRQDIAEFDEVHAEKPVALISGDDLVAYATHLAGKRGLAPATVKRRIACLRSMFGWLLRRGTLPANPFASVEIWIRLPDRLPRCLRKADAIALVGGACRAGGQSGMAALALMATGMRVGELAAIRVSDLDVERGTIRIVGKGDRERQVYFTAGPLADLIRARAGQVTRGMEAEAFLLEGKTGRASGSATIRRILRRLATEAGLSVAVTPHMLRHTAATTFLEEGVDMRFVQRLLGHRSIATTEIYTHVSDSALRAATIRADILGRLHQPGT